jgi:hypothetical protein
MRRIASLEDPRAYGVALVGSSWSLRPQREKTLDSMEAHISHFRISLMP